MKKPDDTKAFLRHMGGLTLAFPRQPLSAESIDLYFQALADLTLEQVVGAIARAIREKTFMPTVAELRELAIGTAEERAGLAWSRAHNAALRGLGGYRPIDFGNPVLHATIVAMGGWSELYVLGNRDAEGVDAAVKRKEFLLLYPMLERRGAPDSTPPALACDQQRVREMPAVRLDMLGEAPSPPVRALPSAGVEPIEYVPPPPEWKAIQQQLVGKLTVPTRVRAAKPEQPRAYTAEEIDQQEQRKADKLAELRERGLLPANGNGCTAPLEAHPEPNGKGSTNTLGTMPVSNENGSAPLDVTPKGDGNGSAASPGAPAILQADAALEPTGTPVRGPRNGGGS